MRIVNGNHWGHEEPAKSTFNKKVLNVKDLKDSKSLKKFIDCLVDETLKILAQEQAHKEFVREQIEQLAGKRYNFVGEYHSRDYPVDLVKQRAGILHEQFVKDFYNAVSRE